MLLAVGGECSEIVADSPFVVRCRWRSSGRNADDVQVCIVTVDSDVDLLTVESYRPLSEVLTLAVKYLYKCMTAAGLGNGQQVDGLRAFVHAGCFSAADLLLG